MHKDSRAQHGRMWASNHEPAITSLLCFLQNLRLEKPRVGGESELTPRTLTPRS